MPASNNSQPRKNVSLGVVQQSFASVLINAAVKPNFISESTPAIVLDDSCIMERDFSCSLMGKIKDINALSNLYIILANEGLDSRLVWVTIEGLPIKAQTRNTFAKIVSSWGELVEINDSDNSLLSCIRVCVKTRPRVLINDRIKIIIKGQLYWIAVKELEAWMPKFSTEEEEDSSSHDESENNNGNDFGLDNEHELDHVSETSFVHENEAENMKNPNSSGKNSNSEDPFEIYKIIKMKKDTLGAKSNDSSHPPGFTLIVGANVEGDKPDNNSQLDFNMSSNNDKIQNDRGVGNYGTKFQESGSILEVMDELIKVGQTMGYNMDGCMNNIETIIGSQEDSNALWRNSSFYYAFIPSIGYSGGILCVWDPRLFVKDNSMVLDSFLAISDSWDGEYILLGDFNEVRFDHERHGSLFNSHSANAFNNFISMAGLIDLPLERYSFTWARKSASKMSKLDRFFISEALCLDKHLSDHRPILLRELNVDYGPTPFRFFHSWSSKKGFDKMVENSWKNSNVQESNSIIMLKKKLKSLKSSIKLCLAEDKLKLNVNKRNFQNRLIILDKSLDQGRCTDDLIQERSYLLKDLQAINKANSLDLAQKAKIRWAVEGDENSKFFHEIINKKRSQLAIRGVLVDGENTSSWKTKRSLDQGRCTDDLIQERSYLLKELQAINKANSLDMAQKAKIRWAVEGDENSKFFHEIINKKRSQLAIRGVLVDGDWVVDPSKFPNSYSYCQIDDLERIVSYDDIKSVVWDCGTNKSPGPDGFTFEFYRKYWNIIDHDVVAAFTTFFSTCLFPHGCNSSFIALIPKSHEAKMVKDFRPISLIGSLYKIITKILANRLSFVISDLVSDVQSAFVSNRQILNGPVILNELLSWCKYKHSKALIFKIDFEKAFDSVRWDYLDVVLNNFGFGSKWRGWIQGCLNSAMGSILVNGSPTTEFKFSKGLKQEIDESLTLSHLFYVDDVIFVGKWNLSNLSTIVRVLKWFYCASGLKINLNKSKLMGVSIPHDVVASAARSIGCLTLHLPFNYLGVKLIRKMEALEFQVFFAYNRALLFKWIWRFITNGSSLWSRFIKAIHGVTGAIGKPPPYSKRSPWLDIVREVTNLSNMGIDLISLVNKKVGNGESTSFWNDLWLGDSPLNKRFSRLFFLEVDKNISVAEKLRDLSLTESFRRPPRSGIEEENLLLLLADTSSVMLPNISDRWSWQLDSTGVFSVKSVREFIDDSLLPRSAAPTRWVKHIPIKINIFAW
ncbi:RNA-directed DNA polymerase, eukaryota [Tanacetum coccineum]|uniref:RNA-directed DNA polymerase, eukaryota n=1 Tax=Tanacetum coccineum TaxID=301880 RepID=A0ABQ5D0J8_9ASTR